MLHRSQITAAWMGPDGRASRAIKMPCYFWSASDKNVSIKKDFCNFLGVIVLLPELAAAKSKERRDNLEAETKKKKEKKRTWMDAFFWELDPSPTAETTNTGHNGRTEP